MNQQIDDATLVERFPYVKIDHDSKHLYRGWLNKQLLINKCDDCGKFHHPPKPICPSCWSSSLTPTEVSGRGTVHLAMFLRQGPAAPDVDYSISPHPVTTIELEEQQGLRFTSTVINCPLEDIKIGIPVELTWIERFGAPFPVFKHASIKEAS